MSSMFRRRSALLLVGVGALMVLFGGCGWFSRSKTRPPEAPVSETAPAPSAPVPSKPTPPSPSIPPTPAPPAPAVSPAPPVAPPPAPSAFPAPQSPTRKAPAGRIADEEMLRGLVQGKTTRAEVRELFGVPQEVVMAPGVEVFVYYRDRPSGFFSRTTERLETLTVRFDLKGILKDFEYRYTGR